jgi:hypothetical protein
MPILAGLLSGFFAQVFTWLTARVTANVAFALAVAATMAASILAMKVALAALWATVALVTPAVVTQALQLVLPGNTGNVLIAIILTDVIRSSWDYWRMSAGLVLGLKAL